MNDNLKFICVDRDATIRQAMEAIQHGAQEIALLVDDKRRLLGTLTDGDIRRAILAGAALDDPAEPYANQSPERVTTEPSRAAVLDVMRARHIAQVPVLDDDGVVVGLHTLHEIVGGPEVPNWAVIMAGGRGSRLAPLTDQLPKPMVPVAGRPILEHLVLHLAGSGVRQIFIAVNYLSEIIEDYFLDGTLFGCSITYLRERADHPLGTAGALTLLVAEHGLPRTPLLVLNGDLMTRFSVKELLTAHRDRSAVVTIGVGEYRHAIPYGVVDVDKNGLLSDIREKPVETWLMNAGIYVVSPELLESFPPEEAFSMPDVLHACLDRSQPVLPWRIDDDWIDVGHFSDLRRARGEEF